MKNLIFDELKKRYSHLGFGEATLDGLASMLAPQITDVSEIENKVVGLSDVLKVFQSVADRKRTETQKLMNDNSGLNAKIEELQEALKKATDSGAKEKDRADKLENAIRIAREAKEAEEAKKKAEAETKAKEEAEAKKSAEEAKKEAELQKQRDEDAKKDVIPQWAKELREQQAQIQAQFEQQKADKVLASRKKAINDITSKLPESVQKAYSRLNLQSLSDDDFNALTKEIETEAGKITSEINSKGADFKPPMGGQKDVKGEKMSKEQAKEVIGLLKI